MTDLFGIIRHMTEALYTYLHTYVHKGSLEKDGLCSRVARSFFVQHTNTGINKQNDHKIGIPNAKMNISYTKLR
jgi:hypothetical protein